MKRRFVKDAGSAVVEAALVLPLFLLLVFGLMQFGLIFRSQLALRDAASIAVRFAVLGNPAAGTPTPESVIQVAKDSLYGVLDPDGVNGSVDFAHTLPATGESATKVQLTYHLDLLLPFVLPGSDGLDLKAEAIMR